MWPLFAKKDASENPPDAPRDQQNEAPARRPLTFEKMLEGLGDLGDLSQHDTALKFWLPEPANQAIREYALYSGNSFSAMLREFFATHCYGIYVVQVLRTQTNDAFRDIPAVLSRVKSDARRKVRKTTYWVPELGKNVAPVKLWVARRLRDDLQALANHVGIPLSQYLREIAISRLLGHGMLPKRPEMLEAAPLPYAQDWCEDKDVPWIEVDAATYHRTEGGREETEWEA